MSRLLTALLLYRSGFQVGKYISIENKIAKNKQDYYTALAESSENWINNQNNPLPFIKYILKMIYSAYIDLERRINYVENSKSDLELVRDAVDYNLNEFTTKDVILLATTVDSTQVEGLLEQLTEEGYILKHNVGEHTYYSRVSSEK